DAQGLSVKAMQSINIFTVGGTLSVNAHGLAHAPGPIAPTVRRMRIMLADGTIVTASPTEHADLFSAALGGYGLFGVILDADLDVVENEMYDLHTEYLDYRDFPAYYRYTVDRNPNVGLVYGRLSVAPESYLRESAIHVYTRSNYRGRVPPIATDQHVAF